MPKANTKLARSRLEALLSMASSSVAEPAAGLSGLYGLLTGGLDKGVSNIERTRAALTYQPRDPQGQQELAQTLAPVTTRLDALKNNMGDTALRKTGSPGMATAAYMVPDTLLTLLGARGMGVKGPKLSQIAERSAGPMMGSPVSQIGAINAWHGSPHDFDRFSMDHIGTGEGAQAYGHGLYFAGDPNVARTYQSKVSAMQGKAGPTIDGRPVNWDDPRETAAFELHRHGGDREAAAAFHETTFKGSDVPALLRSGTDLPNVRPPGRLYDVELAPDETDLLDWDAPLSQQPEKVRAALAKMADEYGYQYGDDYTGRDLYHALTTDVNQLTSRGAGASADASELMRHLGIPGIRYLDGGSRTAGDGSRNYVMFDDSLVKIRGKE